MSEPCRCGHAGDGPHPCHFNAYTCRKPAARRFYDPYPAALSGFQMKLVVSETWACEECWVAFATLLRSADR